MNPAYEALIERLRAARRLLLVRAIERAGLVAAIGFLLVTLIALAVALLAPLHRGEYAVLRLVLLAAAAIAFAAAIARVLATRTALRDAALEAGRLGGEREDELLAALELSREPEGAAAWTSPALREAAVRAAADRAREIPIERLRTWRRRGRWFTGAGVAFLLLALTGALGGARTGVAVRRIANPASAPVAPIKIRVEPGNREIEGGESVAIRAFVAGSQRRPELQVWAQGEWKGEPLGDPEAQDGVRSGERAYAAVFRNVKEDVRYKVKVSDQETPVFAIQVRDLPRATGYRIRYEYPAYTGIKSEESQAVTADLAAPRGTRAFLEVSTNRTVAKAVLVSERGATVEGKIGERDASFQIPIREDDRFSLRLSDARDRRADLGPFELRAIPDRPPTITILAPAPVEDVARDMTTTILAGATDDHGVRKILLRYRVRQDAERIETLHEERAGARELSIRYGWALGAFSLLPGEEIEFEVGAVDGNGVDGPRTTWSDTRRLRFPSATEILTSMDRERTESIETLEDVLKSVKDLQQKSEELSRDVGRSREMTWEQQQEVQKTLEREEQMRQQIDKVAEQLNRDAEKLSQSRALNAELVQKIQEMHQILSQIKDQSLLRAMQRLQEAMKKMSPQEIERALQQFKTSQEEIVKNLERTIEMLKQIRMEEMLEAASERAAEMERRQIAVNDSLSRARQSEQVRELSKPEQEIGELGKQEQAALDSIAAQMQKSDPQTAEQARELSERLGEQRMQKDFQRTSDAMESGDRRDSQREAQEMQKQLSELRRDVDQMREQHAQRKKSELTQKMESAAQDLLDISSLQEQMLGDEQASTGKRAEQQKGLQEATESATEKVAQLAKQSMFITPDIGQSLGRALANQSNAVGRYSNQDLSGGLNSSKEAAISLSQAAAGLLRQKDAMQGSKSSTGMQEAMQSLQNLAGDQQGLNEETMGMMPGGEGGDAPSGQGQRLQEGAGQALGRMAAEQEAIRQGLEEAMQKLGQGGNTLGRLGDVADDMKKVEQDLRTGRPTQDTVERQQRILSRLLDAPRSVEKRDYSRRRTSKPGVDVVRSSPGALAGDLLKTRPSLAALLARGSRDPIAPRYRATVDEYFQSILEGQAR